VRKNYSTGEYSLAQQYVFKLTHLTYIARQVTVNRPDDGCIAETCKANLLQALTGPEGSRRLRLPDFKTIGT
jgi:hypothetical protein